MKCVCGKPTERGMHHGHKWGPWKKFCSDECKAIKARKTIKKVNKKYAKRLSDLRSKRMITNNPMQSPASIEKMVRTHKSLGIRPVRRGGNGQPMPLPQRVLLSALGEGWYAEHAIATGSLKLNTGYPTCYKIDIANPIKKIAIEIDGGSHDTKIGKDRDKRKTDYLVLRGWKVLRFKNKEVLVDIVSVMKKINETI